MATYCPYCGEEVSVSDSFCPFCGEEQPKTVIHSNTDRIASSNISRLSDRLHTQSKPSKDKLKKAKTAVIMTNITKLARKFCYGNLNESEVYERIWSLILNYRSFWLDQGLKKYLILDLGEHEETLLLEDSSWKGHVRILDNFCKENGISIMSPAQLFIIGGNDVIPVPRIRGFVNWDLTLDTDLPYAYDSNSLKFGEGLCIEIEPFFRNRPKPRFYIGRLPFEESFVNDGVEILNNYFNGVIEAYKDNPDLGYVHLTKSIGTSVKDWMFETVPISQDIPIMANLKDVTGLVEEGLFVCPKFDLHNDRAKNLYFKNSKTADFLFFNTHGGEEPGAAQYSNGVVIFDPQCFQQLKNVKLMTSLACYGARYINYKRDDSMLMTALNDAGILSFFGSSRCSAVSNGLNGEVLYGALLLKLYLRHLLSHGLPAGESFMKAKYELIDSGGDEQMRMLTLFEFDIYGDPLLSFSKPAKEEKSWEDVFDAFDRTLSRISFSLPRKVYEKSAAKSSVTKSILDKVRQHVDASFQRIRSTFERDLYSKYGIDPDTLYCAYEISRLGKRSYRMTYCNSSDLSRANIVCSDANGNITEVIYSR